MPDTQEFDGFTVTGAAAEIHDEALYLDWMHRDDFADAVVAADDSADDAQRANRRLVMDFEVEVARIVADGTVDEHIDEVLARFLTEDYVQHDPPIGDGREPLAAWFRAGAAGPTPPPPIAITTGGDMVSIVLQIPPGGLGPDPAYLTTSYRVREGRLCEHWGMFALVARALRPSPAS